MAEAPASCTFTASTGKVPRTHRRKQQHPGLEAPLSFTFSWHNPPPVSQQQGTPQALRNRLNAAPLAAISLGWLGRDGLRAAISQAYETLDVDQTGTLSLQDLESYAQRHGLPVQYIHDFMASVLSHDDAQQQPPQQQLLPRRPPPVLASTGATSSSSEQLTETSNCINSAGSGTGSGTEEPAAASTPLPGCQACGSHQDSAIEAAAASSSSGDAAPGASVTGTLSGPLTTPTATGRQQQQTPLSWLAAALPWLQGSSSSPTTTSVEVTPPRELTYTMFERFVRSREVALRRAFSMFDRDGDGVISVEDLEASLGHVTFCCPTTRCVYRCPRTLAHTMLEKTLAHAGNAPGSYVDFATFRRFFMLLPQTDMAVEYWLRAGAVPSLTEKLAAVHEGEEATSKAAAWGHLFAGAVAGAASRTATAPLETLRLAVMTGSLPGNNLVQAATSIVEVHGWQGLFRGNAVNVLRSAPQKALDFFAFDAFKRLLMGGEPHALQPGHPSTGSSALKTFAAAGLAGATSWALLYPLETVRSRITAGLTPQGAGVVSVMRGLMAAEGPGALYRGLGWSLAGIFPEAALTYGLHDLLKHVYRSTHQGREPGVVHSLSFGVLSAFTGQLVAFPLETIARRLQVHTGPGGLRAVVTHLLHEGGPAALYRGVGAATLRLIPLAVVSFGTYEVVRACLMQLEDRAEAMAADAEYAQLHRFCSPLTLSLPGSACYPASTQATTTLQDTSLLPPGGISTHVCSSLNLHVKQRWAAGAAASTTSMGEPEACLLVAARGEAPAAPLATSPCTLCGPPCGPSCIAVCTTTPAAGSATVVNGVLPCGAPPTVRAAPCAVSAANAAGGAAASSASRPVVPCQ